MTKSLYTQFASQILFPLHEKLKRHTSVAWLKELERSQWWTPEQIRQHQIARLKAVLQRVGQQVPYYQAVFQSLGFNPDAINALDDLQKLPFLTKDIIRQNQEQLKATDAGPLTRYNTGGSSGEPLVFFIGSERVSHDVASKWRATRWWDVDIGDPEIVLWGSPIELGAQDRVRALRDKLLRTELLPAFEMSDAKVDGFIKTLRARRPKMLFGYPSAFNHIAQHAQRSGQVLHDLGIKVAFVTSERLYDHQRETIEEVFGCPVANGYGGRDAGFIAHQCPAGRMHLTAEDIIVEIVDADGRVLAPNQSGEIVVTHLATGDFPFIRYRTGDIGVLDDQLCSCGRGLPVLKEVQGRSTDFIVAADGTVMHGLALIYILRDLPGIEAFKIIQESREQVRIMIMPGDDYNDQLEQTIVNGFRQRLGNKVQIIIEKVSAIAPERSGKYRYVVSKVDPWAERAA